MNLNRKELDAWITREPREMQAWDELEMDQPDECRTCEWIGIHAEGCPDGVEDAKQAAEQLIDAATRLMTFARSCQHDAVLPEPMKVELLRDLRLKIDASLQLARIETARV